MWRSASAPSVDAPEEQPEVHDRPDLVQRELELGDDTEVAAAAAQRPVQVGVLGGRRGHDAAVGGDDARRHEVVAAQAVLARQPADPAAEAQAGDAGVADHAARHRQTVLLRGRVEIGPGRAAAAARPARAGIDRDVAHRAEVDHQAVVDDAVAGEAVAAAAYRDLEVVLAAEGDRGGDIVGARSPAAISAGRRSMSPFHSARASS